MPVAIEALIGRDARRRYDECGDPVYTPSEQILIAIRWFGWVDKRELLDALDLTDCGITIYNRYSQALSRLVEQGRVERRKAGTFRGEVNEYRLSANQPVRIEVPEVVVDDECVPRRNRKKDNIETVRMIRAQRLAAGLCIYCRHPRGEGGTKQSCADCKEEKNARMRAHAKSRAPAPVLLPNERACSRCSHAAAAGKSMCEPHLEWERKRRARVYAKDKKEQRCMDCKKPSTNVRCDGCQAKNEQRKANRRAQARAA